MTTKEIKTAFSDLVFDITREEISDREFQDVLKMVNCIIWDKKEQELLEVLKHHFPEYYQQYKPDKLA